MKRRKVPNFEREEIFFSKAMADRKFHPMLLEKAVAVIVVVVVVVAVVVVVIVVAAVIKLHQEKALQAKNLDQSKTNKQPHKRSLVYLNYRPPKVVLN